ncbi:hypothetical protein KKD20_02535, partial [Patescibacteria group bacterium]|nr:hypothetical protein [Patescibacteria group bacterium]
MKQWGNKALAHFFAPLPVYAAETDEETRNKETKKQGDDPSDQLLVASDKGYVEMNIEGNKLILIPDKEWLATHTYPIIVDPTIEIHVLNIQSYPEVGGEWLVKFVTQGQDDLVIEGLDNTDFGEEIEFVSLTCGEEAREPIIKGNILTYENWTCDGEAQLINKVLIDGKHHLQFRFGGETADAYNDTWWNSAWA